MKKSIPSILEPFVDTNGNITTVWYKFLTLYSSETSTGGVSNYNDLTNLPSIENKKLQGNLTLDDLNIQEKLIPGINITIDENNKINAKEYKPGENIEITEDGVINATTEGGLGRFEVGDIGISPFVDEGKNLRRYLNGQVILQSQFAGFATKLKKAVQTYPNLATTEDNWQAIKTNSKIGQCGKFVIDNTDGTIRLPCIVKLQGVLNFDNIGDIVEDGLPSISHTHTRGTMNITGTDQQSITHKDVGDTTSGAFSLNSYSNTIDAIGTGSAYGERNSTFDASKSWTGSTSTNSAVDSVYGKSNTVQEEAIQYPYFIQVANGVVEEIDVSTEIQLNNPFELFDFKWKESSNNLSWIESKGDWIDGTVYVSAYNHLMNDISGITPETETIGSTTITFYRASDIHKIVLADQETNANNIYNNVGISWYYILDTNNNRFKLPRTKWGFVGSRDGTGNYVPESLPQHTHTRGTMNITGQANVSINREPMDIATSGAFSSAGTASGNRGRDYEGYESIYTLDFNASKSWTGNTSGASGSAYQNNAPVQQRATQMKLYFYVGETVQDANLINAVNILNTKQDKATAVNYNNITNCITHIPQDIKLELNNGVLTLKAGSRVYVPNGAGKFDVVTIQSDRSISPTGLSRQDMFCFRPNGNAFVYNRPASFYSDSVAPSGSQYMTWYDTANNLVKVTSDSGSTWVSGYSLPLGLFTSTSKIDSIDQVFNGFGYIGSTVFALPGVKGLIPNGRNADGSLRNVEFVTKQVFTCTFASDFTYNGALPSLYMDFPIKPEIVFNGEVKGIDYIAGELWQYNKEDNLWKFNEVDSRWTPFGSCNVSSGVISNFNPKTTFQAIDKNDSSWLSSLSMPSGKKVDLTLGASGTTYTAPANGWFYFAKVSGKDSSYGVIINSTKGYSQQMVAASTGNWVRGILPVQKGDVVSIEYNATGNTQAFRFIYTEGDNI